MNLKPYQIEFLNSIKNGEIKNIQEFIGKYIKLDDSKDTAAIVKRYILNFNENLIFPSIPSIIKDINKAESFIVDFYTLIKSLIENKLIVEFEGTEVTPFTYRFISEVGTVESNRLFNSILDDLKSKDFIPLPEFYTFCENGFFTEDEIKRRELNQERSTEKKSRIKAQNWTIYTALASILLSLFTVIFQYLTYSNEREVRIISMPPSDTIKTVIITNPLEKIHAPRSGAQYKKIGK